jgi:hypothetical protein
VCGLVWCGSLLEVGVLERAEVKHTELFWCYRTSVWWGIDLQCLSLNFSSLKNNLSKVSALLKDAYEDLKL